MKKQKPIYHGIFFDKDDIASYKEHLGIDTPFLPDVVENPHVTFGFRVEPVDGFDELFASYTDSDGLVLIVGYGNDGGNEGFLVKIDSEIAAFYQGQIYGRDGNGDIYAHITISYDRASGRKPVDTGSIDFDMLDGYPLNTFGDFGYFDGKRVHYYKDE